MKEARKTGKGNRVWIEILKFLAVSISANLIMVFVGEIIKFFIIYIIRKNTILAAMMINSLLLGLNNRFQVLMLLNLILFGIFESIYLLKTGNIWGVSAINSIWDFVEGAIYGFNVAGMVQSQSLFTFKINNCEILSGGTFGLEGNLLITVILISAINMVMLYKKRN